MIDEVYKQVRSEFAKLQILESPDKIRKVQDKLAPKMGGDEQSLFAGDGFGLLVTNKRVYGTDLRAPIRLEDVFLVARSRFDFQALIRDQRCPDAVLLINGQECVSTYYGVMPVRFLVRVLESLGEQRRKELGANLHSGGMPGSQMARMCAAGVCSKRNEHEIVEKLVSAGMEEDDATTMVALMSEEFRRPARVGGFLMLVIGSVVFSVPVAVANLMAQAGGGFAKVLKGVAVFGALFALLGLVSVITGYRGTTESDLVDWWKSNRPSPPKEFA